MLLQEEHIFGLSLQVLQLSEQEVHSELTESV